MRCEGIFFSSLGDGPGSNKPARLVTLQLLQCTAACSCTAWLSQCVILKHMAAPACQTCCRMRTSLVAWSWPPKTVALQDALQGISNPQQREQHTRYGADVALCNLGPCQVRRDDADLKVVSVHAWAHDNIQMIRRFLSVERNVSSVLMRSGATMQTSRLSPSTPATAPL